MPCEDSQANASMVEIYQALQAMQPTWYVEIGEPHGPGWLRGAALRTASSGPFYDLLTRIGARLHTADRRAIAAAFALRYGWSAGMAIAPSLLWHCVPTVPLENVSFKFQDNTLFERVVLHAPTGMALPQAGTAPHSLVQWLPSHQRLLDWLRTSLVQQVQPIVDTLSAWSRFSTKGLWGIMTSSWGAQFITICGAIAEQTHGLQYVVAFFAGTDVVSQVQPHFYPVTYGTVTHLYHRRATCCRYYRLPQGHYCASCPLLSQAERVQRNRAWMQRLCAPAAQT